MATYVFFIFTIIGRQKIDGFSVHKAMRSGRIPLDIDLYIPIFTVLQFFFYMGLLKVAEQLINPFGDDDEDFELNWLIDRHVKVPVYTIQTRQGKPVYTIQTRQGKPVYTIQTG